MGPSGLSEPPQPIILHCADIGSIQRNRFGWARVDTTTPDDETIGQRPDELVERVAADLSNDRVALGFECPLFIPKSPRGLFVWEAFVSAGDKYRGNLDPHAQDALIAVRRFLAALPDPTTSNAIDESVVYSLAGAALLRSGMSRDPDVVSRLTLVVR